MEKGIWEGYKYHYIIIEDNWEQFSPVNLLHVQLSIKGFLESQNCPLSHLKLGSSIFACLYMHL